MRKPIMTETSGADISEHLQAMRRYARLLTRDAHMADDLVQNVLLRAHERSGTYRPGGSLRAWLLAILHNQFVSDRRRAALEVRVMAELCKQVCCDRTDQDPGINLMLQEVAARFAALPDQQRSVLHLVAVEGLSYQQTAEALAIPIGTVMSRLSRARAALREEIEVGRPSLRLIGGKDAG